ncbi:flagellar biosynthesis repressor FlbT [Endobacter medicaginis]|uniref:Flagellar biosynthesis repressor FlbT n=1 Tax=Endobacter medicaginis TaxID=1181271 RepID=A0A850NRB1_9PROT|nr:flagellar biosynthesis repressor FlbT [Endobacter medicaginis]NVN30386.1 flagellar biosynthesis repressor FlbT [Endobacter medicaginis]
MSNLVLELRAGEMMVVNGAAIRFRSRSRIELASRARFLFGKQIMAPEEATTPARRIYSALQTAYIGSDEEREQARGIASRLIRMFRDATTSAAARLILDEVEQAVTVDDCYRALRLTRRIIRHEDAVLGVADNGGGVRQDCEIAAS